MIIREAPPEEWRALPGGFEHTHEVSSWERVRSVGYRAGHPLNGHYDVPAGILKVYGNSVRLVPWYGGVRFMSVREAMRRAFPELSDDAPRNRPGRPRRS